MNSAEGKMALENECHCHTVCHIAFAVTILHIIAKLAAITARKSRFFLARRWVCYVRPPGGLFGPRPPESAVNRKCRHAGPAGICDRQASGRVLTRVVMNWAD